MEDSPMYAQPVAAVSPEARSLFLRQVALRTLGGLVITAIAALVSTFAIAPAVFQTNKWIVLAVVYGCVFGAQMLGVAWCTATRRPLASWWVRACRAWRSGSCCWWRSRPARTARACRSSATRCSMVVLSVAAMLLYVTAEKREFSMLRAGLTMMGIPLLIMMGLQVIFPFDGMAGVAILGVFLAVSVGALLYTLNKVVHEFPVTMPTEAAFELTIGIVVFFWNLLSFFMRMRRR
jgi:FtsH-binding integral membrane protein